MQQQRDITSTAQDEMSERCCWTITCGDGDTLASVAGAVLVSGPDHRCVLLLAAQPREGAVAGGGVACAHVPVLRHGDDAVGRSDGGGAPRHQSAASFAGGLGGHVCRRTRFCDERTGVRHCCEVYSIGMSVSCAAT